MATPTFSTTQLCVTLAVLCVATFTSGFPEHRGKRSVLQLCSLFAQHGAEGCLRYNGYGCYCGYGNAGEDKEPTDDVDGCCQKHDKCYGELTKTCSGMWFAQLITYQFNCSGPERWKYQCKCKDKRSENPCARSVCDCDLQMARCLQRSKFHPQFENYDHSKCKPKVKHRKILRELRHFRNRKRIRKGRRNRRRKRKHGDRKHKKDKHKKGKKHHKNKTLGEKTTAVEKSLNKSEKPSFLSKWFGWIG